MCTVLQKMSTTKFTFEANEIMEGYYAKGMTNTKEGKLTLMKNCLKAVQNVQPDVNLQKVKVRTI